LRALRLCGVKSEGVECMEGFFEAESVVVVGVSNTPGNLGRAIVYNLMEFRYQGLIHLVGSKGGVFLGHKIYSSVLDIPDHVDLAAILVPAAIVPEVIGQCGMKGIRRVVVESAGFGELGADRALLEEQVVLALRQYGMRLVGPNCIGIINRKTGLSVPFMPFKAEARPGRVGIISQSGGVGAVMINALASENMGFSKFASVGNKLNVNENDLLGYYIRDDNTRSIFCYLEGIADGRGLMEIACRSPKPMVVHKSNNGAPGAVIARSHSASLSTDDRIVDSAFAQCGIIRTKDQQEALNALKGFSLPAIKGNRLGIISRSGGHAVMAADASEELGFVLPHYPAEMIRAVSEASRAKVIEFHNPMDLGDLFDLELYLNLAERALAEEAFDGVLFIHNYQGIFDAAESRRLLEGLGSLAERSEKPIAVCVFTMKDELDYCRKSVKYPIFTDPRQALKALKISREFHERRPLPLSEKRPSVIDIGLARRELDAVPIGPIPPERLARILAAYGIPLVSWAAVESEQEAESAARSLGFPVALKTAEPSVLHKSDAGGVRLNLNDEESVRLAYRDLREIGAKCLVQKMAGEGIELLVGGRQDRSFGPVVVTGLGGIYVEVFSELAMRVAPIGPEEGARLLDELRGSSIIRGVRGRAPLDREGLIGIIERVSWLLFDLTEIDELDLNPVRIFSDGCLGLDWRAVKK
jgi:acyl-CoA synthetase (NDP forming)